MTPNRLTSRRETEPAADLADGRDTDAARFAEVIDNLLATGQYTWALHTLRGIQTTVLRTERVTPAQRRAVWSIEAGNHWPRRGR
jgi:hypothetical protein